MRWAVGMAVPVVVFACCAFPALAFGGDRPAETARSSGLGIWDTGQTSAQALPAQALRDRKGWTAAALGQTGSSFQGDAVISNGRITAVARKGDAAVDVYAGGPRRLQLRVMGPGGQAASRVKRVTIAENSRAAACVQLAYRTAEGAEIEAKFRLRRGGVALEADPLAGAERLQVACPGRFLVLPDFFADDIVIDAEKTPLTVIDVPSENFLLHLTGQGDAIGVSVFENRKQDAKAMLAEHDGKRTLVGSEIGFEGKKIWLTVLEGSGIWHNATVKAEDAGKVLPLDWKMPFAAQWRVDLMKSDGLNDSWEMLLPSPEGDFIKPTWMGRGEDHLDIGRKRWNTVLGWYPYPCWSDSKGRGYLQPIKHHALQFQGPAVLYPVNRVGQTPLEAYTVVDIMRNTLGVGPCEYILDMEGQKAEYRGRATCSVRDELTRIYGKGEQKEKHDEVEKILDDGLIFVKHIRGRIERYVEFGHQTRAYLAEQRKAHPELEQPISELERIAAEIDARVAVRADRIQNPAHVAAMNAEFRKNVVDYEGPDALARARKYALALVEIGDNQDELSGECRWVVKSLRQRAGTLLAAEPRLAPIATEIRNRTQEALRNPASHEGPRH
jgi:hypothetical protein